MRHKQRLDVALVQRGLAPSRERAQALILAGAVFLNNQRADKASLMVAEGDAIEARGAPHPYVSRGGLKLEKALDVFQVNAAGVAAMDIGASTGGFTDVLLRAGAEKVYAIDVGYGQLDWRLRGDPRVVVMERTNARYITPGQFPLPPTLCVMDVSFISIRLILPAAGRVMGGKGRFITLVKPQFEAGRDRVGKKGVVRDAAVHLEVLRGLLAFAEGMGLSVQGADFSPVAGPEGNIEFLFDLLPVESANSCITVSELEEIVSKAHKKFGHDLQ